MDLSFPGDQEDLEEQEESDALIISLVYTSVNDAAAELSEDDCDVYDDDHGSGKGGSLDQTTANYHINSPGVPPTTNQSMLQVTRLIMMSISKQKRILN